ncbi:DUF3331 domain-containing protein [Paraburkholderia sp. GAS42]|uniref:DUF3331 domain-containing protein n=1 Tax=Paraburkholderia sp. GAS42 TaxID=3035135 RepID=UPI003D1FE8C8
MREDQTTSVWQRILDDICSVGYPDRTGSEPVQRPTVRVKCGRPPGNTSRDEESRTWDAGGIADIERRSRGTIAMDWADATLGHYGEQLWSLGVARRKAICALSGEPIKRGDSIYRPRHMGGKAPSNATAMILASFLDARYFSSNRSKDYMEASR